MNWLELAAVAVLYGECSVASHPAAWPPPRQQSQWQHISVITVETIYQLAKGSTLSLLHFTGIRSTKIQKSQ